MKFSVDKFRHFEKNHHKPRSCYQNIPVNYRIIRDAPLSFKKIIPMKPTIAEKILCWFDQHGRKDLPWQLEISPYRVWVSEIMLQQTQVTTVIPYYHRFMTHFPDLESLAVAPLDDVLLHWAGLGYYARARNLHKSARLIHQLGQFPTSLDALITLPGIGRSTAGAILSIAFKQHQPILDGNVKRVLARYHAISGWTGDPKVERELWRLSTSYTPKQRTADYTQAMMDLGATVCTRSKPACPHCPIQADCLAHKNALTQQLPTPKPKQTLPIKECILTILMDQHQNILLIQRPPSGIWGGLWSFPEFSSLDDSLGWCVEQQLPVLESQILAPQRHTFSHFHLDYTPVIIKINNLNNNVMEANTRIWYKAAEINSLALPAPISRLVQQYIIENV